MNQDILFCQCGKRLTEEQLLTDQQFCDECQAEIDMEVK
jgi:hypothetical protein